MCGRRSGDKIAFSFSFFLFFFFGQEAWPGGMWDLISSPIRDQTRVLFIGRWSLNHWVPRKFPPPHPILFEESFKDSKATACNAGDPGIILGWEDLQQKEMATHSSTLVWKIPWTEEPGGLQSKGSQRGRHDWVTSLSFFFKDKVCYSTSDLLKASLCRTLRRMTASELGSKGISRRASLQTDVSVILTTMAGILCHTLMLQSLPRGQKQRDTGVNCWGKVNGQMAWKVMGSTSVSLIPMKLLR